MRIDFLFCILLFVSLVCIGELCLLIGKVKEKNIIYFGG